MSDFLSRIDHPHDVKKLSHEELATLATEIREKILETVDRNGGHLGSNLGTVELTLALHYVYDLPHDRLVWDTSHQTYPHKLITGRRDDFHKLRQFGGICGFCNHQESVFDLFDAGHAGTAVSLAVGTAAADQIRHDEHKSIAVVGDSSIAAGMAFEGLNHGGEVKPNVLVILNDNNMSIDHPVGALSEYFSRFRSRPLYQDLKKEIHDSVARLPVVGKQIDSVFEKVAGKVKGALVPGVLFQELGFNYFGPIEGHDLLSLIRVLQDLKQLREPVLLHVKTEKGHGFEDACQDPVKYHALKNFRNPKPATEKPAAPAPRTFSNVFTDIMHESARKDERVVAITAAMPGGTGLMKFKTEFPDRYFDVGIAEQHGCAFSTGLAYTGLRPVFAVYSTFCQRAYDQFVHDVCIQEKSVIFCMDRAGLAGEDGWTHHGVFDIAYMRCIPNVILMAPADEQDFRGMFQLALDQSVHPVGIRYPKGNVPLDLPESRESTYEVGKAEVLVEGEDVLLFAYGSMVEPALQAAEGLRDRGIRPTVVNARFAKPIDHDLLGRLSRNHSVLVTLEEGVLNGGFGSATVEACLDHGIQFPHIGRIGIPDRFITFGSRSQLMKDCGIDVPAIETRVQELVAQAQASKPRFSGTDYVATDRRSSLS